MTSLDTIAAGFGGDFSARQFWLNRTVRRTARGLGIGVALIAVIGVVLGIAAVLVPAHTPVSGAAGQDNWSDIVRPLQMFGLVGTEFTKQPSTYAAQRATGGGRRDVLTFGSLRGNSPSLQLSFYRVGRQADATPTLAADLERLDPTGPISAARLAAPTLLLTRFGPFEATDLSLATDQHQTPCLGFRSKAGATEVLRIVGLACGTASKPIGRDLVGCVIDRIDLLSAGSDEALKTLFVEAERRRGPGCAPAPAVSAGTTRTTWLDANAAPPALKGLSAETRGR